MKKVTRSIVARLLPERAQKAHKGDFGRVLVIAGSCSMCGAGFLCAKSALVSGAGLVYWALPTSMQPAFAAALPEVITLPLPETKTGEIAAAAWKKLNAFISRVKPSLLVVGPGMGESPLLPVLLKKNQLPLVADASALTSLATRADLSFKQLAILTPHPGEMARLLKTSVSSGEKERVSQLQSLVRRTQAVCLLKGHGTLIGWQSGGKISLWQNTTGGPALAKGGSGDVLSGIIAGLWSQRGTKDGFDAISAFQMAACGVYIHGLAGDLAARSKSTYSILASDIIDFIPSAFKQVLSKGK